MRCRISGSFGELEIPLLVMLFYLFREVTSSYLAVTASSFKLCLSKWREWHCQVGSLAGAAHLLNNNTGVLRSAQWEQKSHVEQKGKSWLDFDFQYEYKPRNRGLSILWVFRIWSQRCQKSYHRDNWLVAAKRSERRCFLILRCRLFLSLCRRSHQV